MTDKKTLTIRTEGDFGADFFAPAEELRVAAVTPCTTIDFPGKLSAVVFVQGCPWRCGYCQNAWMQPRELAEGHETWQRVTALLSKRRGLLDGVVFSGGEPTVDPALPAAVRVVKERYAMAVGLHTGGAYPRRLKALLPDLDWVGLDVKAPPEAEALFESVTGRPGSARLWRESFDLIRAAGIPTEVRMTVHPELLSAADIETAAQWLAQRRVTTFALQIYRRPPGAEKALPSVGADYPGEALEKHLKELFPMFILRRD